ncbi:MAG TPA: peptide MFS transporter [Kofleriaceae bacterium]|jgi:POT family proton-dependent oligopeptide transporter
MSSASGDRDTAFFGHPAGLSTLFFTEMWERFSYYGMRAFLIFYMQATLAQGGRGMSKVAAAAIIAVYQSAAYLLALPGGWIADRFLGQQRAVIIGGLGIVAGNALLALPVDGLFYPGLAVAVIGTGLLKPNVSTIVGQLYKPGDERRESGYTIYYMGINIGAFAAPLVCGFFAQSDTFQGWLAAHHINPAWCWKFAFGIVALGMAGGVIQYLVQQKRLGEAGAYPTVPSDPVVAGRDRKVLGGLIGAIVVITGVVVMMRGYLDEQIVSDGFGIMIIVITIALFTGLIRGARDHSERMRTIAIIPLFIGSVVFFALSEQASSTLNIFADEHTRRELLGIAIPSSYYQSVNSVFIMLLTAPFAWLWLRLIRANKEPPAVTKFAIGMIFIAIAYAVMLPTLGPVGHGERVSGGFLIGLYFFTTVSEMCISPVGLSSMSKLAPKRLMGMVMGTWFLGTSLGNYLAGRAAGFTAVRGYSFLFWALIVAALAVAAGLFAVAPAIKRLLAQADEAQRTGQPA